MKTTSYKKYLAGILALVSCSLLFGAVLVHAQVAPIEPLPPLAPVSPLPVSPSAPTTPGTTGGSQSAGVTNQIPAWYDWASSPGTSAVALISTLINDALSLLVSLGGIIILEGLNLSGAVFSSQTVQAGFSISLSLANLGFVLGIIVIAIATILRNETYGIKQMLWKLIAMAILVNFGLVITGPIVGLADNLTGYFLNASGGAANFTTTITTAFLPAAFRTPPDLTSAGPVAQSSCAQQTAGTWFQSLNNYLCVHLSTLFTNSDQTGASDFVRAVMSGLFSAIFIGITAFTLILIGLLMIIRYVYLSILLIILPLAWLTWIFPKFDYLAKWWGLFLKWTMFPALSLFFLYLAILSVSVVGGQVNVTIAALPTSLTNNPNDPMLAAALQTGHVGFLPMALQEIVMVGLCLGGIYAANSLSLTGSDAIMHGAKWVGGQVGGFAGKHSKRVARRAYQSLPYGGGDAINRALQRSRIPGVSSLGRSMGDLTKKGGADLVKKASTDLKMGDRSDEELRDQLMGTGKILGADKQLAYIQELQKRGKLDKIDKVQGQDFATWLDKNESLFTNYGQGKLLGDVNKQLGSNKPMRAAQAKVKGARSDAEKEMAEKELDDETAKFTKGWDKADANKVNGNEAFKEDTPIARALAKNWALQAPQFASGQLSKMDRTTLPKFTDIYIKQIRGEMDKRTYFKEDAKMEADIKDQEEGLSKLTQQINEATTEAAKKTLTISRGKMESTIKDIQKQREELKKKMTVEEKNLELAMDSIKKSLAYNATFGDGGSPGAASATAPKS